MKLLAKRGFPEHSFNNIMKFSFKRAVAALALWTVTTQFASAETTLKVGDPAPKLDVAKWVQGDGVKEFKKGKAYIVEFWATWCGPCRVSIPHLNEIHNKFKDKGLVVIGQNCWERDESLVEPFIKKMGDKMTYNVPLDNKADNKKGAVAANWMEAAGQNGIPSAFLIDTKGTVVWIGHPMNLKESMIEEVLAGKFDVKAAAEAAAKQAAAESTMKKISTDLGKAMKDKNWAEALAKTDELEKALPSEDKTSINYTRFNILIMSKDYPAASKLASKMSQDNKDPQLQNAIAWRIITDKENPKPDYETAAKIIDRGVTASGSTNSAILDTAARVYYMKGDKEKAASLAQKALDNAEGDEKATYKTKLEKIKKGEPLQDEQ